MSSVDYTCPTSEPVADHPLVTALKKLRKPRIVKPKDGTRPVKARVPKVKQADAKATASADREVKVRTKRNKNRVVSDVGNTADAAPVHDVQVATPAVKEKVTKASKEAVRKNRYAKNPLNSIPSVNAPPTSESTNVLDDTFQQGLADFYAQLKAMAVGGGTQSFVVFI